MDSENSLKFYKIAETLCPENVVNLSNISIQLNKSKKNNKLTSEIYAERIIDLQPNSSKGYVRLARVYIFTGKEELAIPMLKKALPLCTDYGAALELLYVYT